MPVSLSACSYQWHTNRTNGANREASLTSRYPLLTVRLGLAFWQFVCFDNSYVLTIRMFMCGSVSVKEDKSISLSVGFRAQNYNRSTDKVSVCPSFWLPWVPEVFSRVWRGASFRRPQADTCSAKGRRHERRSHSLFKTWPKAETAREKPLAPRLHFDRIRK